MKKKYEISRDLLIKTLKALKPYMFLPGEEQTDDDYDEFNNYEVIETIEELQKVLGEKIIIS